jgi:hypothetical protein
MRDSNIANAAKESAQAEFPHGLLGFRITPAADDTRWVSNRNGPVGIDRVITALAVTSAALGSFCTDRWGRGQSALGAIAS